MTALLSDILILLEVANFTVEIVAALAELVELLSGTEEPDYADLSLEEKTDTLKRCTKIVANLGLDLACYPLGYATTILFDLDGNPI